MASTFIVFPTNPINLLRMGFRIEDRIIVQRSLTQWWNEETKYVSQKIEKWLAFARGYNRLQLLRWSEQIMQISSCSSSNDATCTSQFYSLKRFKQTKNPEEIKIKCYDIFNYQSDSKLDSNCLKTYQYDHSIYFKTIGDIKNNKNKVKY